MELRYENANRLMVGALPELGPCYERYEKDWDNFGGDPPGAYIVYSEILGLAMNAALTLPRDTPSRSERLAAYIGFLDKLRCTDDPALSHVAIDTLEGTVLVHPAGPDAVEEFGGPELRRWFKKEDSWHLERIRRHTDPWDPDYHLADLWGVREALADVLPETEVTELPGVSHPADHHLLSSLEEARKRDDAVVYIAAYGTSHPYVVAPANAVHANGHALTQLARDLAAHLGGEEPDGEPASRFFVIPRGERVWEMNLGDKNHTRYEGVLWVCDKLGELSAAIADVLAGHEARLRTS